ncbi:ABC transporter permease subunit [Vulcanisaeta sp. JCM 16161]|uniref:ABC transporter permease subunit n=1 Tax=Vulcanisaeta sp. JCM 16161 TaxID=1295372 RepID=UPI00406C518D
MDLDNSRHAFTPFIVLISLMLLLPIAVLLYEGFNHLLSAFTSTLFIYGTLVTLLGASIAAALTLILGLPTAYAISRGLIPKPLDSVIGGLLTSPLTIPHTIIGLSLLILVSPISPIPIIRKLPLVDTIWGLVAAYFVVSAPITIGAIRQVFDNLDPVYEYVGLTLGLSQWGVFMRVVIPMTRRELVSSFLLAWGRSISEFGSIVILTYYVVNPPLFNYVYPLPTLIWYSYEVYGLPLALGYASASLIISIIIIVLIELISGGTTRFRLW